jgi:hypothetical protein
MQPQLSSVFPLREPISQQAEPRAVAATLVRAVEDEPRLPGRSRRVILALSVAAVVIIGVVTGLKFWPSSRQAALIAKATPVEQSPHALRASTSTSNPQPKQSDSSGSSLQGKIVPPAPNPESKSQPAVRTVEFTLDSEPTGAKAKIDGERTCTTPCMLRLAPGPHDVILFAENHKTTERAFDISSDDAADNLLRVTLPEATESWVIVTKPDKLSVEVDGKLKGPAPITIDLTVGQHQLRVYGNVGEHTETVDVAASDTEAIQHRCISLSADSPCPSPKPSDSQPGPSQQSN